MKLPEISKQEITETVRVITKKKNDAIDKIISYEHTPIIVAGVIGLLVGIIIGFLLSPVKKGISVASNNEITNIEDEFEDDEEEEEAPKKSRKCCKKK